MTGSPRVAAPGRATRVGAQQTRRRVGLAVVVACVWFLTLDARHLLRADEGRYAEIAREMVVTGDWVTPRYNGLLYFEKPPLQMWATAAAYELFGVGDWQARLWVAIGGAVAMVVTMAAARRWYGERVALFSGLALLAAPAWNLGGHFNSLDMGVSAALACVLAATLLAQHPQTLPAARRRWMWAAWAAMGVAVLTKGLIGVVLPGLALVVYSVAARDLTLWRRLHLASGTALLLAITTPWFIVVSLRNPAFAQFFFIHEHFERYTSSVHQRSAPWWFFVPQLLAGFLPWLGLAPRIWGVVRGAAPGAADGLRPPLIPNADGLRPPLIPNADGLRPPLLPNADGLRPPLLLAAWAGSIFVFFSLSGSKLPGYILPVYPALALLAGLALATFAPLAAPAWRRLVSGMLIVAVIAMLTAPLLGRVGGAATSAGAAALRDYGLWLAAAAALLAVGLLVARGLAQRGDTTASIVAYATAFFAATTVGIVGHESLGRGSSGTDLVPRIQAVLTPQMPIYSVRLLDHTLPFYLRRTTIMVEQPDELEFGTRQEPQKWLPTLAAFEHAWRDGPHAVALMAPATHAELEAQQLPMVVLAQDERRVVVANFEPPAR